MTPDFGTILEQNKERIWRICRGYLPDRDDQQDLFQEITINLWKHLSSFKGNSSMHTWVYRVAVNTALMHLRSDKKRSVFAHNTTELHNVPDKTESLTVTLEERKITTMYTAINKLSNVDRLIILMVLEGEGYKDIAQTLGISVSNVGVKINRIKNRITKLIQSELRDHEL